MSNSIYIAIPLMGLLVILQTAILPRVPLLGVAPQLLLLVALAWGLLRGPFEGLIWAFIAGLLVDLFSITPFGLSSLIYMAAIALALLLQRLLPTFPLLGIVVPTMAATLVYLLGYFISLRVFGLGLTISGLVELWPMIILHSLLILPIYWIMQGAMRPFQARRVEV